MTGSSPAPAVNATSQLAESIPGFNPASVINAGDKRLGDYLAMPTQQILDQFGPRRLPGTASAAPVPPGAPASPGNALNALNPAQLISPVVNALGTLGNGQFAGMDPTSMLSGIANAFDGTAGPLQQALGAVQPAWQGASSAAAGAKTAAALANGTEVASQASGLSSSLSTAVAEVGSAQTQLIAIINEFLATLAAIGPNIIFPWGWAAVVAAANHAVTHAAAVMTELQTALATQANAVSAMGAPVAVTSAPQLGASPAAAMSPLLGSAGGTSALSPLMYAATSGMSPLMSAVNAAGMAGRPAVSGATPGTLAGANAAGPTASAAAAALKSGAPASFSHAGGGGGGVASPALASRITPPMTPAASESATTAMPAASARPAAGGMPAGGGGMMGAPLAGAGHANGAGAAHTAASYLHTSDQGGKVVGGRNTVAPPVIGEVDPNDTPDIELRI